MIETETYLYINDLLESFKELEQQFKVKVTKLNPTFIFVANQHGLDGIYINKNGFVWRNDYKISEEIEKVIVYLIEKGQLINWNCDRGFYAKPELQTDLEKYVQWLAMENKILKQEIEELRDSFESHRTNYKHEYNEY